MSGAPCTVLSVSVPCLLRLVLPVWCYYSVLCYAQFALYSLFVAFVTPCLLFMPGAHCSPCLLCPVLPVPSVSCSLPDISGASCFLFLGLPLFYLLYFLSVMLGAPYPLCPVLPVLYVWFSLSVVSGAPSPLWPVLPIRFFSDASCSL